MRDRINNNWEYMITKKIRNMSVLCHLIFKTAILTLIILSSNLFNNILIAQDISGGLVAYWTFDCSASDFSGNGYEGILHGNKECVDGKFGKALRLNGKDNYVLLPFQNSSHFYYQNGFSWAMWFKAENVPTSSNQGIYQVLMSMADTKPAEDIFIGFGSMGTPQNKLMFEVDGEGGIVEAMINPPSYAPANGFENGKWYFVCGVKDQSNLTILYVNGIEVARLNKTPSAISRDMNACIGAYYDGSQPSNFFQGSIDEIRVYNRPLSDGDVLALYELTPNQLTAQNFDVNFGRIVCEKDTSITVPLINNGPGSISLAGVKFSDGKYFSATGSAFGVINDKDTFNFKITFTPPYEGTFNDTVLVKNSNALPPLMLFLSGTRDTIVFANTDSVQFGKIELGFSKDTTINFVNTGTTAFSIVGIKPVSSPFEIISTQPSIPLMNFNPRDTFKINLRYTSQVGKSLDSMVLQLNVPCGKNQFPVVLNAEGIYRALITLMIPNQEAKPGDLINIPIKLLNETNLAKSNISGFEAELFVNPTILIPESPTPQGIISGNTLSIKVTLPSKPIDNNNTLANLAFRVALGNDITDTIKLGSVRALDGITTAQKIDGILLLKGVCVAGGTRLFKTTGNLYLASAQPNPASDKSTIEFEIIEQGENTLYLVDALGETKLNIIDIQKPGRYVIDIDVSRTAGGQYFMVLKTPTKILSNKFQIVK